MSGLNACGLSWQPLVAESGECALSQGFRARKWMISLQGGVSSCEISSDTDCTQSNGNLPCSQVGGGGKGSSQRIEEPQVLLWVAVRSCHIIEDQNAHQATF